MYGMRIKDTLGNSSMITANMTTILSCGNLTMSNTLEGDNTYGEDVALGATYPITSIGVLAYPVKFTFKAKVARWKWTNLDYTHSYPYTWYAEPSTTYYTKALDTKVMSIWTPGSMLMDSNNNWDGMRGAMPLAYWDVPDGTTTISSVRIWAATEYAVYDYSVSTFLEVFTIGNIGVSEVNYSIYLKKV
jgi:hypothetical protein